MRDIGVQPGMPGALNTLTSLFGEDYLDPYFASGVRIGWERTGGSLWRLAARASVEKQRSATLQASPPLSGSPFRPVRVAARGTLVSTSLELERRLEEKLGLSWGGVAELEVGSFAGSGYAIPKLELSALRPSEDRRNVIGLRAMGGMALGSPAPQQLFLLGGRSTLPGHPYRSFAGDAFVLTDLEASRDLAHPFVRGRLLFSAGWTGDFDSDSRRVPVSWAAVGTKGVRTSAGIGVALLYDLLRIDLVRGFGRSGETQLLVSLDPRVWPWL
jgi:hypothetical protein